MRLEAMVAMANLEIPGDFLRKYISSALDVIIHVSRMTDGTRKLVVVQEVTGMEGNIVTTQEIFSFQQTAIDADGRIRGRFGFRGIRPKFMDKFKRAGIEVSNDLFDPARSVEV
jgi:pilus assembly protein CpaF